MKTIKEGDILTLNENVIMSYDHGSDTEKHTKLSKGSKLQITSISVNNSEFLTATRIGFNDNFGLRKSNFKL